MYDWHSVLTQRKRDVIAHGQQLSETDDFILGTDADLLHFLDRKAYGVLVVRGHHYADFLLLTLEFQLFHTSQAFRQRPVVILCRGLEIRTRRIGIA